MNSNDLVAKYQKERDEFYEQLNKKSRLLTHVIDRCHYCFNGNISPCYICGNCGTTLISPWSKNQYMVVTHNSMYCDVCHHTNYLYNPIRKCTHEGGFKFFNYEDEIYLLSKLDEYPSDVLNDITELEWVDNFCLNVIKDFRIAQSENKNYLAYVSYDIMYYKMYSLLHNTLLYQERLFLELYINENYRNNSLIQFLFKIHWEPIGSL